jgi:ketosteroid isomerase-like protein
MSDGPDAGRLRALVDEFVAAIDRADLDALAPLWSEDASMYFPFANTIDLVRGREAVLARFARMFADLRARRPDGPPYIRFEVRAFELLALDADHALVFALLAFAGQLGRRTLVLRRSGADWRIAHVHASNFDERPPR